MDMNAGFSLEKSVMIPGQTADIETPRADSKKNAADSESFAAAMAALFAQLARTEAPEQPEGPLELVDRATLDHQVDGPLLQNAASAAVLSDQIPQVEVAEPQENIPGHVTVDVDGVMTDVTGITGQVASEWSAEETAGKIQDDITSNGVPFDSGQDMNTAPAIHSGMKEDVMMPQPTLVPGNDQADAADKPPSIDPQAWPKKLPGADHSAIEGDHPRTAPNHLSAGENQDSNNLEKFEHPQPKQGTLDDTDGLKTTAGSSQTGQQRRAAERKDLLAWQAKRDNQPPDTDPIDTDKHTPQHKLENRHLHARSEQGLDTSRSARFDVDAPPSVNRSDLQMTQTSFDSQPSGDITGDVGAQKSASVHKGHAAEIGPMPSEKDLPADVLRQMVQKMTLIRQQPHTEMRIRLKPEYLGNLRLNIVTEQHRVTVKVMAESHMVKDMIEHNVHHLRHELAQQGLQIDSIDVKVENSNQWRSGHEDGAFRQQSQGRQQQGNSRQTPRQQSSHTGKWNRPDPDDGEVNYFA